MLKVMKGSELMETIEVIDWIWKKIIPRNHVTVLASRGGIGKSAFALWLADQLTGEGKRVLYIDAERCGSSIKTRNLNWKLPHFNDISFTCEQVGTTPDGKVRNETACFSELTKLNDIVGKELYDLVILDSLTIIGRAVNMNNQGETANLLKELTATASIGRTGILLLAHTKKFQYDNQELTIDSVSGNAAITDLSRSVLLMERGLNPEQRILHNVKNNFEKLSPDIIFDLTENGIKNFTITNATSEIRITGSKADRFRTIARTELIQGKSKKEVRKILVGAGASPQEYKRAIDDISLELNIQWEN